MPSSTSLHLSSTHGTREGGGGERRSAVRGERGEKGGGRHKGGVDWGGATTKPWKNEEQGTKIMVVAHRRGRPLPESRRNPSIDGEPEVGSTNRKHKDEVLDETNATTLSDFANDAQLESNCLPKLELPRTSTRNWWRYESCLAKRIWYLERVRRDVPSRIYIAE